MSGSLIRQDLIPITVGYLLVMGTLAVGLRQQRRDGAVTADRAAAPGAVPPGWRPWLRLIRHLLATFAGGYLVLMAVVVAYYYGVARVSGNFLESAVTGCALLLGLSAPLFLAASWLAERYARRRRHQEPESAGGSPGSAREKSGRARRSAGRPADD